MNIFKNNISKIISSFIVVFLIFSIIPNNIYVAMASSGSVRVIVENNTFTTQDAPWKGVLVDEEIDLSDDMSAISAIGEVLKKHNYSVTGIETGYISSINGLSAFDGGEQSGWMATINDWFTNESLSSYKVSNNRLVDGDVIKISYSCKWGGDIGSDWSSDDKTLTSIGNSAGILSPVFNSATYEYDLYVASDSANISFNPIATNKNFQSKVFLNNTQIVKGRAVTVKVGDIVVIKTGDPLWESMNETSTPASEYKINIKEKLSALNISIDKSVKEVDGKILAKNGDILKFKAVDQDGNETPVTWKSSASTSTAKMDVNTGELTIINTASGSTFTPTITATSTIDSKVSAKFSQTIAGYEFSQTYKNYSVALSKDGQQPKAITLTGGFNGHNVWSYDKTDCVELTTNPEKTNSIKFNALRPGKFQVRFNIDNDETYSDVSNVTITGVAVEDEKGNSGRTKICLDDDKKIQLTAYTESGKNISSWSSSNEEIATVDSNGKVIPKKIGSTIIQATDSSGTKGGIKVVVVSSHIPYFESMEFLTTAFVSNTWVANQTFEPTKLEYMLPIKAYGTSTITFQNSSSTGAFTLYDTDKYIAQARYVDIDGNPKVVTINSNAITKLEDIPFGLSDIELRIFSRENEEVSTTYILHVSRPYDTTKTIKATTGLSIVPTNRALKSSKYNTFAEGTFIQSTKDDIVGTKTSISASVYYYHTYLFSDIKKFALNITGTTAYERIRVSIDDAQTWTELKQGGGLTPEYSFDNVQDGKVKVLVEIISDSDYYQNLQNGLDGFDISSKGGSSNLYTIWVESINANYQNAYIMLAESEEGDWYPAFRPDLFNYSIVVDSNTSKLPIKFKVVDDATVKVKNVLQTPDENGEYKLELTTTTQTVDITSNDGLVSNSYTFKIVKKSAKDVPDKVVDFLCINSQYTNAATGMGPESILSGSLKSLGNFGGYATFYYENPIIDNPNNKYGIDFYVYGNANVDTSTSTGCSFFEPASVWVSEDGNTWYNLAGSEHYEDSTIWDYSVTYTNTSNGKTSWIDNNGNSFDGTSYTGAYALEDNYYLHKFDDNNSVTLTGLLLPTSDGTIAGSGIADANHVSWGYADCGPNGTIGADANPYLDNTNHKLSTSGFDLKWAVDSEGNPVDVSNMQFHYIKTVTATNYWHSSFGEKSPEISSIVRTTALDEKVGKTSMPSKVIVSSQEKDITVDLTEDKNIYDISVGDTSKVSIKLEGASDDDNIYINNTRVLAGQIKEDISVPNDGSNRLVRIIVQNGDKEPVIILLRINNKQETPIDSIQPEEVDSEVPNTRPSDTNMIITDTILPTEEDTVSLSWAKKLGTGQFVNPSSAIIVQNRIVLMSGSMLYALNKTTGEIEKQASLVGTPGYSVTGPTYGGGMIFCPLSNGTIQAFNADTFEPLWVYHDALKGQANSPIVYSNGYIYTGFWLGENKDANYVAVSTRDEDNTQGYEEKSPVWSNTTNGGYYWSGAAIVDDYIIYGTDDGALGTSYVIVQNKNTGEVIAKEGLSGIGDIRSSICFDKETNKIYFTSKNGYLVSATLDIENGNITNIKKQKVGTQSTSTPVVYKGKVYIGTGSGITSTGSTGEFTVCDADSLNVIAQKTMLGYPQCSMLLSTAKESEGYLYFYSTYNAKPGGVSLLKVKNNCTSSDDIKLVEIYDANGYEDYCLASLICDNLGNLYYKNDSGNIISLKFETKSSEDDSKGNNTKDDDSKRDKSHDNNTDSKNNPQKKNSDKNKKIMLSGATRGGGTLSITDSYDDSKSQKNNSKDKDKKSLYKNAGNGFKETKDNKSLDNNTNGIKNVSNILSAIPIWIYLIVGILSLVLLIYLILLKRKEDK